jgi:hypothetical protein
MKPEIVCHQVRILYLKFHVGTCILAEHLILIQCKPLRFTCEDKNIVDFEFHKIEGAGAACLHHKLENKNL